MTVMDRTALVTGASEGIGFAIARALVDAGANVVLTARRDDPLRRAAEALGPRASWVCADAADQASATRAVNHALDRFGGLDLTVANAGIMIPGALVAQPMAEVDLVLSINLRGTIALMAAAAPAMADRPGSAAVVVTSSIGRVAAAGMGAYGASKAALHYLVPTWATELAGQGTRVNAVCAGITETPGLAAGADAVPGLREMMIGANLVKRIAGPAEVAAPVLTLLDNELTGYVTGSIWDVDGGYMRDRSGGAPQEPAPVLQEVGHG